MYTNGNTQAQVKASGRISGNVLEAQAKARRARGAIA